MLSAFTTWLARQRAEPDEKPRKKRRRLGNLAERRLRREPPLVRAAHDRCGHRSLTRRGRCPRCGYRPGVPRAYTEGLLAGRDGRPRLLNPYTPARPRDRRSWHRGHQLGRSQHVPQTDRAIKPEFV